MIPFKAIENYGSIKGIIMLLFRTSFHANGCEFLTVRLDNAHEFIVKDITPTFSQTWTLLKHIEVIMISGGTWD